MNRASDYTALERDTNVEAYIMQLSLYLWSPARYASSDCRSFCIYSAYPAGGDKKQQFLDPSKQQTKQKKIRQAYRKDVVHIQIIIIRIKYALYQSLQGHFCHVIV